MLTLRYKLRGRLRIEGKHPVNRVLKDTETQYELNERQIAFARRQRSLPSKSLKLPLVKDIHKLQVSTTKPKRMTTLV
jgi:hypothetical protein